VAGWRDRDSTVVPRVTAKPVEERNLIRSNFVRRRSRTAPP
jgi:hypothetical protein